MSIDRSIENRWSLLARAAVRGGGTLADAGGTSRAATRWVGAGSCEPPVQRVVIHQSRQIAQLRERPSNSRFVEGLVAGREHSLAYELDADHVRHCAAGRAQAEQQQRRARQAHVPSRCEDACHYGRCVLHHCQHHAPRASAVSGTFTCQSAAVASVSASVAGKRLRRGLTNLL